MSVAFSPDGKRIVSASRDNTLRLWDVHTGQSIGEPLQGHQSPVLSVAFSPDGNRIISASWDQTLRLWDAKLYRESSLAKLAHWAETLCPLSEGERRQLGLYDPTTAHSPKPRTEAQRLACGE